MLVQYVDMHHPYAIRAVVFGITLVVTLIFLVSLYHFHSWQGRWKQHHERQNKIKAGKR